MKRYSVLMSLYEKENPEFLDIAINSMVNQSIPPNEIVIVKDGYITSELQMILDKYEKKYPDLFNICGYETNRGLGFALNYGINQCKNELIARMDTDDISIRNRCEQQLRLFSQNFSLDIVGGNISEFIDNPNNIVAYRIVPNEDSEIKKYAKKRCPFNHMTVMYKKSAVLECGNYKELFWNEDYYLWVRMVEKKINMGNTGTVLVNVRTGKNMYKRRGGIRYFSSEKFIQKYMLKNGMISKIDYIENIVKRFIVQCLLPNTIRGWVFRMFARK